MDQSFFKRSNVLDAELLPLPEGNLVRNIGLDLIIVVTKTDFMADLERDYNYRWEHFDFLHHSIRRFGLQFGAALFYVSAKEIAKIVICYTSI